MSGSVQNLREVVGSVAGAIVGDDAVDVADAVGGEECLRSVHESDCVTAFSSQGFGVGEAGVSVDSGVQVDEAGAGAGVPGAVDCFGLVAAAAVHAPAATVGYATDLLDVDVDHVAGPAGDDQSGFAAAVAVGTGKMTCSRRYRVTHDL